MSILQPGAQAPDFKLPVSPDKKLSLSDYRGRPVVLVFYPADWSPVCGSELAMFNEALPELERLGAQVLGISADLVYSHMAFAQAKGLRIPLLSDVHPHEACRAYGAFRERDGHAERALFVIDAEGVIRWSHLSPPSVNPGVDGVLKALESLPRKEEAHA